jgi:hypothetical protein
VRRNGKSNGHARFSGVEVLTRQQAERLFEKRARALLGVSRQEAVSMVERGELRGTAAEDQIRGFQFLLSESA